MAATTTAWTITYTGIVAPFGMIVTENNTVRAIVALRYLGSAVAAANGNAAYSRYHG